MGNFFLQVTYKLSYGIFCYKFTFGTPTEHVYYKVPTGFFLLRNTYKVPTDYFPTEYLPTVFSTKYLPTNFRIEYLPTVFPTEYLQTLLDFISNRKFVSYKFFYDFLPVFF